MAQLSEIGVGTLLEIARVMDSAFEPQSADPHEALDEMFQHKVLPLFYNFAALEQKNLKQVLAVLNEIRLSTTPSFEVLSRIFNKVMIA